MNPRMRWIEKIAIRRMRIEPNFPTIHRQINIKIGSRESENNRVMKGDEFTIFVEEIDQQGGTLTRHLSDDILKGENGSFEWLGFPPSVIIGYFMDDIDDECYICFPYRSPRKYCSEWHCKGDPLPCLHKSSSWGMKKALFEMVRFSLAQYWLPGIILLMYYILVFLFPSLGKIHYRFLFKLKNNTLILAVILKECSLIHPSFFQDSYLFSLIWALFIHFS